MSMSKSAVISKKNEHIEEYLDYYCNLDHSPEYAVLLKGVWGSGKTWFIKKYREKLEKKKKVLYVSLYGITDFAEIDDIFFQQLHPVLSSKGMAIAGKILKGTLKTTLKIDFGDNSNGNASVSSQIPDIDLPDYLKQTEGCILFFDDLERCKLSIENILGYINYLVEHDGLKTIIVANEDEILQCQDEKKVYNRIKEKIIGKTFKIVPDLDMALRSFIESISTDHVRKFLYQMEDSIKQLYFTSEYENLRQLKQIIWDFERFYHFLPDKAKNSETLLQEVLKIFVALSFELKRGSLQPGEIGRLQDVYYLNLFQSDEKKKDNHLLQIIKKYQNLSFQDLVLGGQCWQDFFDKGIIEKTLIEKGVANSIFFQEENTANWVKLWHYHHLEDDEFQGLLDQVEKKFNNLEYKEIGVILHIVGLFLRFSEMEIYKRTKCEVLADGKTYIDALQQNGQLEPDDHSIMLAERGEEYGGLGFPRRESKEFKEFCNYIVKKINNEKIARMPEAGNDLLKIMRNDVSQFCRMIYLSNSQDQIYYNTPIFNYIDPGEFVTATLSLDPKAMQSVFGAIGERYKPDMLKTKLVEELDWLESVRCILQNTQKKFKGKLSGHRLQFIIESMIDKAIENLKKMAESEAQ